MTTPYTTEWITTEAGLRHLRDEWDRLLAESHAPSVFLTWEWCMSWWEHLARSVTPAVALLRRSSDGKLAVLAPLVARKASKWGSPSVTLLSSLGGGVVCADHLDAIIHNDDVSTAPKALLAALETCPIKWDMLWFDGYSETSTLLSALPEATPLSVNIAPYLPLPATWEEYLASLSSNKRQQIKRFRKRFDKAFDGDVTYETVTDLTTLHDAMESLFMLHQGVQNQQGRLGAFDDPAMRSFHRSVAERLLNRGWLRLHRLQAKGSDVAVIYCFQYGDVVSFYATGFDLSLEDLSPGRLIMDYAIERTMNDCAREFDFLRGDEGYKTRYTTQVRRDQNVAFSRRRPLSLAVKLYAAAKKLKKHG